MDTYMDIDKYVVKSQSSCDELFEKYKIFITDDRPVIFDICSNVGCFTYSCLKHIKNGLIVLKIVDL